MVLYDVTLPLDATLPVWPGDPPIRVEKVVTPGPGNPFTVSQMQMSVHAGTHVDAPSHILAGGQDVDALPLDVLIGPALVVDARGVARLSAEVLSQLAIPRGVDRVLFLTDNTRLWSERPWRFHTDFVGITEDGARWLVERGVRLVGVDYLSVAPYGEEEGTHRVLLTAGVVIIEGLYLVHVPPGIYELLCLPLKLVHAEAAPARVLLKG
ncbi:MAG: cyclase family protein [Chloroflexi bacterium]|nr:cyclase family protein [Chloroflexota bacterium]